MTIKDLRAEMGLSLEEFSERVGLNSRGRMSVIERENACSFRVALAIEAMSAGADGVPRINAADLNDDVKAARHGVVVTAPAVGASPGKADENSRDVPAGAARAA